MMVVAYFVGRKKLNIVCFAQNLMRNGSPAVIVYPEIPALILIIVLIVHILFIEYLFGIKSFLVLEYEEYLLDD
jgi:hypothetical protein